MALSVVTPILTRVTLNQAAIARLSSDALSPAGRDLYARSLRVTRRMVINASGRPGPNVRTGTLRSSISSRIGTDSQGLVALVGVLGTRTVKRNYNYALILEGLFPRGGSPPEGAYPFIAKSLDAAK